MPPPYPTPDHDLVPTRTINLPREKLYRCWTEPALLPHWFCPKPWGVARAELDVRSGGNSCIVMLSPDGQEFPNPGVYLEVVPNERLVFTDAYTKAWEPSAKPFMTGIITFEDHGGVAPGTPPGRGTGPPRTSRSTRKWASTRAGARPPTSSSS